MTYSKISIAAAGFLAAIATTARADQVTYDFTATVTNSAYGYYETGQAVSGSFTFQAITGQPPCDGSAGLCLAETGGVAMTLVPNAGATPLSVSANTDDDTTGNELVEYTSNAGALANLWLPYFAELNAHYNFEYNVGPGSFGFTVNLRSSDSTLQSAPDLDVLPALSDLDIAAQISYDYISPVTGLQQDYTAQITSLTLQSAPEPASIALLATGAAALGFARRRRG